MEGNMKVRHLLAAVLIGGAVFAGSFSFAGNPAIQAKMEQADQYRQEKSFRLAVDLYEALLNDKESDLSESKTRELTFKAADSAWRTKETRRYEQAVKRLKDLAESKEHDRSWAEASESLADHYMEVNRWSFPNEIKQYLENAREFWAGSKDIATARPRFIAASFKLGEHIQSHWGWGYAQMKPVGILKRKILPEEESRPGLDILYEEILQVAKADKDKANAYYSLAMSYYNQHYNQKKKDGAIKYFTEVFENYPTSEWADDAYYYLGQYYEQKQDFVKALAAYRGLVGKYRTGQSPWVDDAKRRIKDITLPQINVGVAYTFVPDSDIQFSMNWRNVDSAQMTLYKIDLNKELQLDRSKPETDYNRGVGHYSELIKRMVESERYTSYPVALSWRQTLKDEKDHHWQNANKGLAEWQQQEGEKDIDYTKGKLAPGAYLLLVNNGSTRGYELVLVSDMGFVTKTAGESALFYAFDGKTGQPRANASVAYQYRYYNTSGHWMWEEGKGTTDGEGVFHVGIKGSERANTSNQHQLFAVVSDGIMQAFSQGNYYDYAHQGQPWRLYAYSDRPAYRPGETISFKGSLRKYDDQAFQTPLGQVIQARIYDERGNKVKEQKYTLNDFGSFHDTLELDEKAVLGAYRMDVYTQDGNTNLGQMQLFRLEEYKLPEFLVNIKPKSKDGQTTASYRVGDEIEVEVDAQYYFGGAVANANVEYLIYQNNYNHVYYRPRAYPWYYADIQPMYNNYYGQGALIKKETIQTDTQGKAAFTFETPENMDQDLSYRVEVRVVDQSRREISASTEIKVTRQAFYAYLNPKQNLYRPGDKAEVEVKLLTANNDPVTTEGTIAVSRNWWRDPVVKEKKMVTQAHYEETELFKKFVKTDAKGEAVFAFEPERDGYYVVKFIGFDDEGQEVVAQANVFVCAKQSKDLGYKYGGLQIISEKDTYAMGETARVMLVADQPDTWVLLTKEIDEILDVEMVHMDGAVKLVEFPVTEGYTPNVFLSAVSGLEYQLRMNALQLIVPPEDKFLNVKIISDKEVYRPQEEGVFDIEVTDQTGAPVVGEVSLGVVDSSVYYIQSEMAMDIRQFFYGTKRQQSVQTQSSFSQRSYVNLDFEEAKKQAGLQDDRTKENAQYFGGEDKNELLGLGTVSGGKAGVRFRREGGDALAMVAEDASMEMEEKVMPASSPRKMLSKAKKERRDMKQDKDAIDGFGSSNEAGLDQPQVRSDFRSTVVWQPTIVTDTEGQARVKVTFPDSLTTWRATARSLTVGTSVGTITHETKTSKDIIVRLQAPRFFTERDEVTISANVHNYTDKKQKIKVTITADGLTVKGKPEVWVTIPSHGEERVDWTTLADQQGMANITVMAQAQEDSDAMVKSYPVIPHGIEKFIAKGLALQGQGVGAMLKEFRLNLPKERIEESTSLQLVLSPSLAATMLDALPYLADYPYGCVEQTMSRFLPAVIVKKTMKDLGLSEPEINGYINHVLNPREDPVHPERRTQTTVDKLDKMTKAGLDRLYDFQHKDGGWGWWKEGDSDRFMTAYVVWGLSLAKEAGLPVKANVLNRGVGYLQVQLVEEEDQPDMLAWMLHALAQAKSNSAFEQKQTERLWAMRDKLNPYTRALFALSEHYRGHHEQALVLARNMANGMEEDQENGTIRWGESGIHYRWSEGGVEATAFAIKALSNIMPESELIRPAVKWMTLNRRGSRWKNTRDTAIAILGLADYLKTTDELTPDFQYSVMVNGKAVREGKVNRENVFTFNRNVVLPNDALRDGDNKVKVQLTGKGALYVSGYMKYFTLEEDITPAGNEVFVKRQYFIQDQSETLLKGYKEDWTPLESGDKVKSGDRVRVEIILEAKNNYEYLVIEDYKPAGMEAVELKSGSGTAEFLDYDGKASRGSTWLYKEYRDKKAAFFIDKLKQGKHRIRYELRAEIPGEFHGMPNQTHAMYVPEIRANSAEMRVVIEDRGEE